MDKDFPDVFRFCPVCGTEGRPGKIPFVCSECGFHFFFSPATAVGALINDAQKRLLFIERAKAPGKGKLGMPGGFVDSGETAEQAVTREVEEEVGLRVSRLDYLVTFPNIYRYRGIITKVLDLFFVCEVEDLDDLKISSEEVNAIHFEQPTKQILSRMAFESNRKAVEVYLRQNITT